MSRRGFMFAGLNFRTPDGGVDVHFTLPGKTWSEAGLRLYEERRALADEACAQAVALGLSRLVVEDGATFAVREEDGRPGWPLASEDALQVMTAQVSVLAHELRSKALCTTSWPDGSPCQAPAVEVEGDEAWCELHGGQVR